MSASSSTPLPIAFCITELEPGGAERAFVEIVTRLDRSHWAPHVICLGPRGVLAQRFEEQGIPVTCLGATSWKQLSILWKLTRVLRKIRPVIVQTFLFHANILGRIAARLAGIPHCICGVRVAERRSGLYLRIDRTTDFLVDYHVCVSQSVRDFMQYDGKLPAEKLVVIPNGIDREKFSSALPLPLTDWAKTDSKLLLLTVGRLDQQKGVQDIPVIAEMLNKSNVRFTWWIAGEGPEKQLLASEIRVRALTQQLRLMGQRNDVPALLKTADLLVFPSRWEGMPNAILEAMAAGLPIVTTAVEGIEELLTDGESAEIVPIGDLEKLTAAICKLAKDAERRKQYAQVASKKLVSGYDWNQIASQYESLYQSVLEPAG